VGTVYRDGPDGSIRGYGCTAVLATITKRLKLADASVAEDGYQDVINGVERKPYPTAEGLRNIQRLMKIRIRVSGNLKVEDLIAHWIPARARRERFYR
jgi:hypothetical protein